MRYLVVIDLPDSYANKIKDLQEKHRPDRWKILIDPHITLAISRETDLETKEAKDIFAASYIENEPFEIKLKELKQFKNSRVRVIYVYAELTKQLKQLQKRAMEELGGAYSLQDQKRFIPHVTVSNRLNPKDARRVMKELKSDNFHFDFICRSISLYKKGSKDKKWVLLAEKWLG